MGRVLAPIVIASTLFFASPQQIKAENPNQSPPRVYALTSGGLSEIDKLHPPRFLFNLGLGLETDLMGGLMAEFDISGNPFPYAEDSSEMNVAELSAKITKIFNNKWGFRPYLGLGGSFLSASNQNIFNSAFGGQIFAGMELSDPKYAFRVETGYKSWIANSQALQKSLNGFYEEIGMRYKL